MLDDNLRQKNSNMLKLTRVFLLSLIVVSLVGCANSAEQPINPSNQPDQFNADRAYQFLTEQMDIGPRFPGSPGHLQLRDYIVEQFAELPFEIERQTFEYQGLQGMNLIARANRGKGEIILLGAHYDSRARADQSKGQETAPVPGAVDGASGVAVLLELANSLDLEKLDQEIWLAFFDFEDNGSNGIAGWDWIVGSTYMAQNLTEIPAAMVLVDMIGDADQQLFYETNSTVPLREEIWAVAADLGFAEQFIARTKYSMIDDHTPFLQQGIPAVDIIDFDYPYWHTVEDSADKASPESLFRVGRTLQVWLEGEK